MAKWQRFNYQPGTPLGRDGRRVTGCQEHMDLSRELIYATALLHDIGRAEQYLHDIPHDIAGTEIAREILADLNFISGFQILNILRCICIKSFYSIYK